MSNLEGFNGILLNQRLASPLESILNRDFQVLTTAVLEANFVRIFGRFQLACNPFSCIHLNANCVCIFACRFVRKCNDFIS